MKKITGSLICMCMIFVLSNVGYAKGVLEDNDLSISGAMDYFSSYVWRGFTLDNDPVLQPGLNVSGYGITVSFWGSFDFENNDGIPSDETDLVINYSKEIGDFGFSIGNTWYDFPGFQVDSKELYIGISLNKVPLAPKITYFNDYGTGEGTYISIDGSYGIKVKELPVDLGLHLGLNNELFIAGSGSDYAVSLGTSFALSSTVSCSPSISYSMPAGDLADEADGNQESKIYGGFSLGF